MRRGRDAAFPTVANLYATIQVILRIALTAFACLICLPAWGQTVSDPVSRFEGPGPFHIQIMRKTLCCDRKGKAIDVYLPDARKQPSTLPVVTWGNGTWASPKNYDYLLRHLASWGIAVVATRDSSVAKSETMRDALALVRKDKRFASLDLGRVAAAGHSQGAGGAINAAIGAKGGIQTAIAIDLPARRHCDSSDCDNIPYGLPPNSSVLFLSGEKDPLSPPREIESYFNSVPATLDKAKASVRDADHNDIQGQPDCHFLAIGCRHGVEGFLPYVTAWLVWKLNIDSSARQVFVGADAPFLTDERLMGAAFE